MSSNIGAGVRIDIGADVIGKDGEKLGSVAYVVVQPPEMHVRDIVVGTGAVLGRDVVVPVSNVSRIDAGKVYLSIDKGGLSKLPDYVEVDYTQPPEQWIPPPGFLYGAPSVLWPGGAYALYQQPASVTVNAPKGSVGLREGMDVRSSDGHLIGRVHAVDVDGSGDVSEIVVKQGILFTHDVTIPMEMVSSVEEDLVTLNLTRDEAERALNPGPS
jgi:uncharacterized protein YrrD